MKTTMYEGIRKYIQDLAIFMIVFSGIAHIVLYLPHRFSMLGFIGHYYSRLTRDIGSIHGIMSTAIGFILLFLSI